MEGGGLGVAAAARHGDSLVENGHRLVREALPGGGDGRRHESGSWCWCMAKWGRSVCTKRAKKNKLMVKLCNKLIYTGIDDVVIKDIDSL